VGLIKNNAYTKDNYYDKDDVLGWPLKQMSTSYESLVNDYHINFISKAV